MRRGSSGGVTHRGYPRPIDPLVGVPGVTYRPSTTAPQRSRAARLARFPRCSPPRPAAVAPSEEPMLIACWSSKGGAGTTVVAATLALLLGRRRAEGAVLVDLAGDAPAALGLTDPDSPGIADWLAAGPDVPPDALHRLELHATDGLALLPRGAGPLAVERAEVLARLLSADGRAIVADCGTDPSGVALTIAAGASRSLFVTRPCFLALRRAAGAAAAPLRGGAAERAGTGARPRRRRARRRCPRGRRGRRRSAGRAGGRRRSAHHPATAGLRKGPVPCRLRSASRPRDHLVREIHAAVLAERPGARHRPGPGPRRGPARPPTPTERRRHRDRPSGDRPGRRARAPRASPRRRGHHRRDGGRTRQGLGRAPRRAAA